MREKYNCNKKKKLERKRIHNKDNLGLEYFFVPPIYTPRRIEEKLVERYTEGGRSIGEAHETLIS